MILIGGFSKLDDLISDLQLFSASLTKLGWIKQAKEVDLLTSSLLFGLEVKAGSKEALQYQRKALLIKAKALLSELQSDLGDTHINSHTLALISFELRNEIENP